MRVVVVAMGLLAFATCLSADASNQSVKETTEQAYIAAVAAGDVEATCRGSIGMEPALALVRYCRFWSSASRPRCDTGNHCALIVWEIRRSCHAEEAATLPCKMDSSDWERVGKLPAK